MECRHSERRFCAKNLSWFFALNQEGFFASLRVATKGFFPLARAYVNVEAANLMRFKACALFDAHQPCGAEANMALLLAAEASWEAANACLQFHGGFGFACEYDVERRWREARLARIAPISTNLILAHIAQHVLGLPRSY